MELQIKTLRLRAGMTRRDLATQMKVSHHTIRSWELSASQPSLEKACLLAEIFDCTLDELAGRDFVEQPQFDDRQQKLNEMYEILDDEGCEKILEQADLLTMKYKR